MILNIRNSLTLTSYLFSLGARHFKCEAYYCLSRYILHELRSKRFIKIISIAYDHITLYNIIILNIRSSLTLTSYLSLGSRHFKCEAYYCLSRYILNELRSKRFIKIISIAYYLLSTRYVFFSGMQLFCLKNNKLNITNHTNWDNTNWNNTTFYLTKLNITKWNNTKLYITNWNNTKLNITKLNITKWSHTNWVNTYLNYIKWNHTYWNNTNWNHTTLYITNWNNTKFEITKLNITTMSISNQSYINRLFFDIDSVATCFFLFLLIVFFTLFHLEKFCFISVFLSFTYKYYITL